MLVLSFQQILSNAWPPSPCPPAADKTACCESKNYENDDTCEKPGAKCETTGEAAAPGACRRD